MVGGASLSHLVNLVRGDLEADDLVRVGVEEEVLPALVVGLDTLLERTHEAVPRLLALLNLWVINLEQDRSQSRVRVHLFRCLVSGAPDLDRALLRFELRRTGPNDVATRCCVDVAPRGGRGGR